MDRLPLVQALTQAGLERAGAEQVATALGDAIESSVASKADVARVDTSIARVEASIGRLETFTKAEIARLELATRGELHALEHRMTLRLGGMLVGAIGVLFLMLKYTQP